MAAVFQCANQGGEAVHGHPRAMRTAAAGCTHSGVGRFNEMLGRGSLLHLVEDTAVGGDNEFSVWQALGRLNQARGGAHDVRLGNDVRR